jgi:hypothetical protein
VSNQELITKDDSQQSSYSLYIAIAAMAGVVVAFVLITFSMFLRSSAYETVKNIQANTKINGSSLGDYDTTSPVKAADIEETVRGIENKIDGLDNSADYGPESVSDANLGLER